MDCVMFAFDTATKVTGYSKWVNAKLSEYGVVDVSDINDSEKRLDKMISDIYELLEKNEPVIVVTELTAVSRNVQSQRMLTLLLGAIRGKCVEKDIYYHSFRPTEWRALIGHVSGKRDALKRWSLKQVKKIFNVETDNDNISDSILIGQAYINLFTDELEEDADEDE